MSYFWVLIQWVWTFRKLITIVGLTLTLLGLLWVEIFEQRKFMRDEFAEQLTNLSRTEAFFKEAGDAAFSLPSRDGSSVPSEIVDRLYSVAQSLHSDLSSFPQPSHKLAELRDAYASEVADLSGALNLYKPGAEETIRVLTELDEVGRAGTAYHSAADDYRNSVWATFRSAF